MPKCPNCGKEMQRRGYLYIAKDRAYREAYECKDCDLRMPFGSVIEKENIKEP